MRRDLFTMCSQGHLSIVDKLSFGLALHDSPDFLGLYRSTLLLWSDLVKCFYVWIVFTLFQTWQVGHVPCIIGCLLFWYPFITIGISFDDALQRHENKNMCQRPCTICEDSMDLLKLKNAIIDQLSINQWVCNSLYSVLWTTAEKSKLGFLKIVNVFADM